MGASGKLCLISLSEYPFEVLKRAIIDNCVVFCDYNNFWDTIYESAKNFKSISDICNYFWTKVVSYCPSENGVIINNKKYDNWGGCVLPIVIDNHLVLYESDLQGKEQDAIILLLESFINLKIEIWT